MCSLIRLVAEGPLQTQVLVTTTSCGQNHGDDDGCIHDDSHSANRSGWVVHDLLCSLWSWAFCRGRWNAMVARLPGNSLPASQMVDPVAAQNAARSPPWHPPACAGGPFVVRRLEVAGGVHSFRKSLKLNAGPTGRLRSIRAARCVRAMVGRSVRIAANHSSHCGCFDLNITRCDDATVGSESESDVRSRAISAVPQRDRDLFASASTQRTPQGVQP